MRRPYSGIRVAEAISGARRRVPRPLTGHKIIVARAFCPGVVRSCSQTRRRIHAEVHMAFVVAVLWSFFQLRHEAHWLFAAVAIWRFIVL